MTFAVFCAASIGFAQETRVAPPSPRGGPQASPRPKTEPYTPTAEELKPITARLDELNTAIKALKDAKANDDLIVDAESCAWIVHNIVRVPGGFIDQGYVNRCMTSLNDGLRRAAEIKAGTAAWQTMKGRLNRAYRSSVDGTAQPFHLSVPASYDPSKPTPLYVYLHGRSQYDPDLGMGWAGGNDRPSGGSGGNGGGPNADYIRVDAFGRANNSYRWAGETDVLEVIAALRKQYNIDPDRILLAGFSLGGAGSWQIGLHYPDMFCGLEIDAGVIGTRKSMDGMTPSAKAVQAPYGIMIDHALNIFDVPLVAYAGANDAQLASSNSIRQQLGVEGFTINQLSTFVGKGKDINALFLATPKQGHSHATGDTLALINEFNAANMKRGRVLPDHIQFITYTTRYNHDFWITVDGMGHHFERAKVDAQRDASKANYTITTTNVSRLLLDDMSNAKSLIIDGKNITFTPAASLLLTHDANQWSVTSPGSTTGLSKHHGLQGPVNDAFLSAFLCVTPTGQANSERAQAQAAQEQSRFTKSFTRDYLGEAPTKNDSDVTPDDIAHNNLILFGDPASNKLIARIVDKLPLTWTKESIIMAGKTYSTTDHTVAMIYPNPLNTEHYVVINAGLSSGGFNADTAIGDYAILKIQSTTTGSITQTVESGGTFDESWQVPATNSN